MLPGTMASQPFARRPRQIFNDKNDRAFRAACFEALDEPNEAVIKSGHV